MINKTLIEGLNKISKTAVDAVNTSNNTCVRLITHQSKDVINILKAGEVYKADYNKIGYRKYKKEYKKLAERLSLDSCPIFCLLETQVDKFRQDGVSGSFGHDEANNFPIIIDVPLNKIHTMDYYAWADYLYYTNWETDTENSFKSRTESRNNIDAYIQFDLPIDKLEWGQAVIDEIRPEWIVNQL